MEENIENKQLEIIMDNKFDRVIKIITVGISFIALVISIIALTINRNGYYINKEKFNIDTNENLLISVGTESVDTITLKYNDTDEAPSYRVELSICFVNTSNLPIYIDKLFISRSQYSNGNYGTQTLNTPVEIEELDLPIMIEPQATKYENCYARITIPDSVNLDIIENFPSVSNLEITEIGEYLFFEKCTDLIGNEIVVSNKDGNKHYKYNPTVPFELSFWSTKGNYFSTEFYEGLHLSGIKFLNEKYDKWSKEISYGETPKIKLIMDFVKDNIIILIIVAVVILFFEYRLVKKYVKSKNRNNKTIE